MWVEKNGPTWRIRDLAGGRKVTVASGYPTKTAAKRAKAEIEVEVRNGTAPTPHGGRMLLRDVVNQWWPLYQQTLKPRTQETAEGRIRNHILPLLGHLTLDDLCHPTTIPDWLALLRQGRPGPRPQGAPPLSPQTVHNTYVILRMICQWAVQQRLIRVNPCDGMYRYLPKVRRKEMRFLTEPEIGRLVAAAPLHWRPLVILLAATGLRWGEAIALRVKDVDILAGRLTVNRALHELGGRGAQMVFTTPKTAASRRTVTFPPQVGAVLAPLVTGKQGDDLVFTTPSGRPVRYRNFRRNWIQWTVAAGLDAEPALGVSRREYNGLRIHDLRHTHAAHLISAGVPLTAVQRRLGHTSIAITSDLYGHLLPVVNEALLATVESTLAHVAPVGESVGETRCAQVPRDAT